VNLFDRTTLCFMLIGGLVGCAPSPMAPVRPSLSSLNKAQSDLVAVADFVRKDSDRIVAAIMSGSDVAAVVASGQLPPDGTKTTGGDTVGTSSSQPWRRTSDGKFVVTTAYRRSDGYTSDSYSVEVTFAKGDTVPWRVEHLSSTGDDTTNSTMSHRLKLRSADGTFSEFIELASGRSANYQSLGALKMVIQGFPDGTEAASIVIGKPPSYGYNSQFKPEITVYRP
jgi:hypothetical protein